MDFSNHETLFGAEAHVPHSFEYANSAARLAATGFIASDVNKWALDLDTSKYFIMTNHSPITWKALS